MQQATSRLYIFYRTVIIADWRFPLSLIHELDPYTLKISLQTKNYVRQGFQKLSYYLLTYRIIIAKVANLLGPGTRVPAVKSNNFTAGTLQA